MNNFVLNLKRKWFGLKAIIGQIFIGSEIKQQCYTLEGINTQIPSGTYQVVLYYSPKFGRVMPHVINVPGREGILIHYGNTDADTEGCILVGKIPVNADFIGESRAAFSDLYSLLEEANRTSLIYIAITNEPSKDSIPTT